MSLGRARRSVETVPAAALRATPRGPFYDRLAAALDAEGFDAWAEEHTRAFYAPRRGRPSLPPGTYFRMLFVGSLEAIPSQRELAWRCADSLSLRRFLGYSAIQATPDHSTLTLARQRLPPEVHAEAMQRLWEVARKHDVLRGRSLSFVVSASPPDPLPAG